MKVKNEYVEIKLGNRVFKKQNMILNTYINRLFASQINTTHSLSNITNCYLKFDTPIENVDYNTTLNGKTDFDVFLYATNSYADKIAKIIDYNQNSIKVKYTFDNDFYQHDNKYYNFNDFSMFNGRKITAIGFGQGNICFTFLDTSNMNIVINDKENILITRVDSFKSDGMCKGFDYPLHLVNDIAYYDNDTSLSTKAQLYSIGFGNNQEYIEEEYLVGNVQTELGDTYIKFNATRTKKVGYYPSEDLHLGFYPIPDNSKYVMFKYRLYRGDNSLDHYLDEYYTMAIPNEDFGSLEITLKLERM